MKKFYIMALLALCAVCTTGCSDDEETVVSAGLTITSNKAEFKAVGGTAQIEVESDYTVQAVSEAPDWCTVSVNGKTIEVTVTPNVNIESRSTMVNVSDENGSVRVPVYQLGDIFTCELTDVVVPTSGNTFSIPVNTLRMDQVSVENLPEWLTYTFGEGAIVFTATPMPEGGLDRSAEISIVMNGKVMATAEFKQYTLMKLEGTYIFTCQGYDGNEKTGTTTITKNADGTYSMGPLPFREGTSNGYVLQLEYSEETRHLTIKGGQFLEAWSSGVYCYFVEEGLKKWDGSDALEKGEFTASPSATYVADGVYDENNKRKFVFKDGGTWDGHQVDGFSYMLEWSGYYYSYGTVYNLVLTQQ